MASQSIIPRASKCSGPCSGKNRCAACQRSYYAEVGHTKYRQRYLPQQVASMRRRLSVMEREARAFGMLELATQLEHANRAWDEAIDEGRARTGYPDIPRQHSTEGGEG